MNRCVVDHIVVADEVRIRLMWLRTHRTLSFFFLALRIVLDSWGIASIVIIIVIGEILNLKCQRVIVIKM